MVYCMTEINLYPLGQRSGNDLLARELHPVLPRHSSAVYPAQARYALKSFPHFDFLSVTDMPQDTLPPTAGTRLPRLLTFRANPTSSLQAMPEILLPGSERCNVPSWFKDG